MILIINDKIQNIHDYILETQKINLFIIDYNLNKFSNLIFLYMHVLTNRAQK